MSWWHENVGKKAIKQFGNWSSFLSLNFHSFKGSLIPPGASMTDWGLLRYHFWENRGDKETPWMNSNLIIQALGSCHSIAIPYVNPPLKIEQNNLLPPKSWQTFLCFPGKKQVRRFQWNRSAGLIRAWNPLDGKAVASHVCTSGWMSFVEVGRLPRYNPIVTTVFCNWNTCWNLVHKVAVTLDEFGLWGRHYSIC